HPEPDIDSTGDRNLGWSALYGATRRSGSRRRGGGARRVAPVQVPRGTLRPRSLRRQPPLLIRLRGTRSRSHSPLAQRRSAFAVGRSAARSVFSLLRCLEPRQLFLCRGLLIP